MFSHLFNTYQTVVPPPKAKKDVNQEITGDTNSTEFNPFIPFGYSVKYQTPQVTKPDNQQSVPETTVHFMNDSPNEPVGTIQEQTNDSLINEIINTGRQYVGGKYTYGGTSPSTGFDCSGFLQYIFKQHGVDIPRDTSGIFKSGKEVSLDNAKPGDIICSKGSGQSGKHVQMVSRIDPETNQIYVIEAKGSKYGITEGPLTKKSSDIITVRRVINFDTTNPMLTNQDIQKPSTVTKFDTQKDFVQALVAGYKRALASHNLDPNYAYILTAQAAIESNWGKSQSGKFNFSGIKAGKNTPGTYKKTREWSASKGYYRSVEKFRDFSSIDDYCNYKVELMGNKRYNIYSQFAPTQAYDIIYSALKSGYGSDYGGQESVKYAKSAEKIYNSILKMSV